MKYINAYTNQTGDNPNSSPATQKTGSARFGEQAIVYPVRLHREFVPYSDIAWAFIFDQDFQTKVMGRRISRGIDYLMLISHDSKTAFIPIRKHAQTALDLIKQYAPTAHFGYSDELQEQFFGEETNP